MNAQNNPLDFETVYQSTYLKIMFDTQYRLMERQWEKASTTISQTSFQEEMLQVLSMITKFRPLRVLGNTKDFHFVITPEMQSWADQEVYSQLGKLGVSRMAFVISEDFYAQLSVEQAIEESKKDYEVKYFRSRAEALAWLLE
ncbi:STAS/SEC14 domain-containing protein [Eisenibacter elegans]|jgi:hypothetical protein|uniref:STAS/SEC14 domain-containing protein n=1 Tax=Eisenibacter elegans TaxID=997 RepID=UPI00040F7DC4|nr:STAS/SEC14 domain-containing protein [Eisenibacter elegans]